MHYAITPITRITNKNLDVFEDLLVKCIWRWGTYLASIVQELRFSFKAYYLLLSEGKSKQCNTLSLLSDKYLLYELSSNLPTLITIIDTLNNSSTNKRLENGFVEKLYWVLLTNQKSIFTRELKWLSFWDFRDGAYIKRFLSSKLLLDYRGMSPSKEWFTEDEKSIFEENFIIFSWKILEETLNDKNMLLHSEYPRLMVELFKTIAGIIQSSPTPENLNLWLPWSHHLWQFYYNNTINDYLAERSWLFNEVTLWYADEYNDVYSTKTFFDSIIFWLFDISISYLFYNKNTKEDFWWKRETIMRLFDFKEYKTAKFLYKETEKRMNIYMKQEIKKNLEWWYPMIINIFFYLYWYQIAESFKKNEEIKNPFIKDILLLLKEKLPLISKWFIRWYDSVEKIDDFAIRKSKEILEDIFVDNIEYIADRNVIRFFYREREAFTDIYLNKIN